jgi:hypothetical protein
VCAACLVGPRIAASHREAFLVLDAITTEAPAGVASPKPTMRVHGRNWHEAGFFGNAASQSVGGRPTDLLSTSINRFLHHPVTRRPHPGRADRLLWILPNNGS